MFVVLRLAYAILEFTAYLNVHSDIYSGVRDLYVGLSLHQHPYFVYASSLGSGKFARLHRLVLAIIAQQRNKYLNLTCLLKYLFLI